MTFKEHALQYASLGLAVLPLVEKDKRPLTKNGCKDATTDCAIISDWWDRWPNANIGIATGKASNGLMVIDLDVDEEKGKDGRNSLTQWEEESGCKLPRKTWVCMTGRKWGGKHFYYRGSDIVRNRTGILEGVDVRGEGGYVVAPPSIHPSTGQCYAWAETRNPSKTEPVLINEDIRKFLSIGSSDQKESFTCHTDVQQGQRTDTLVRMIASMKGKSFPDSAIRGAVIETNATFSPPLTEKELSREVFPALKNLKRGDSQYSIMKNESIEGFEGFESQYEKVNFMPFTPFIPVDTNELPSFEKEWLPLKLECFAMEVSSALQVPMDMVGVFILGMISIGAQGKMAIRPKGGWKEQLNVFIAIMADSSERKTPVGTVCVSAVYEYEKEENERRAPEIADYLTKKDIMTNQINAMKKASTKKKGEVDTELAIDAIVGLQMELDSLEEVHPYVAIVDDITQEALAKVMYENDGSLAIVSTEGGVFNMMNGKYKSSSDYDVYLKGYSTSEPLRINRVGRPDIFINHPILSILLMVQPVIIKSIMDNDDMNGRGLNARFLYAIPKSKVGNRDYEVKEMNEEIVQAYTDLIYRLMAIPKEDTSRLIDLTDGAKKHASVFFYEIECILGSEEDTPMKAWIGKLHGQTMKIAGLLHCALYIEHSHEVLLEENTMKNAVSIGKYFLEHARAIYKMSGASDSRQEKDAKYILKKLEEFSKLSKPSKLTKRELHQFCKGRKDFEKVEYMGEGLNELISRGYIKISKQQTPGGGRPTEVIEINPEYQEMEENK